jgi:hypothetical protein
VYSLRSSASLRLIRISYFLCAFVVNELAILAAELPLPGLPISSEISRDIRRKFGNSMAKIKTLAKKSPNFANEF